MSKLSENSVYSWVLFMLFPFATFLFAVKNFFKINNQRIILAFSFLYGYSVFLNSGDIMRYEQTFYSIVSYSWDDFIYLISHFLSYEKYALYEANSAISKPDVYALILNFFVSRFTDNPRWLWALISLIYTYLILNFVNTVSKETNWFKNLFMQRVFFIGLVLIVPFYYGVSGVRFWPALFLFVTYAIKFSHQKRVKYLFIAASSILIHYTFAVPFLLLLFSIVIPKNKFFYKVIIGLGLIIFISSSVTSSLNAIKNVSSTFEETTIESSASSYTDEEYVERTKEGRLRNNWYVRYGYNFILYFFIVLAILDIFGVFQFKENLFLQNTYPLMIVFFILTLLTMNLGPISRFKYIFYLLILARYTMLAGIQPLDNKLKYLSYVFTPILFLYVLVILRAGFYTVDPLLLINNSIMTFFMHSNISLSEFLVGH